MYVNNYFQSECSRIIGITMSCIYNVIVLNSVTSRLSAEIIELIYDLHYFSRVQVDTYISFIILLKIQRTYLLFLLQSLECIFLDNLLFKYPCYL